MGPGPIDVNSVPTPLLFLFVVILGIAMTVGLIWIVIPYCLAKVVQMVMKLWKMVRRGSEDGIY